MVPRGLNANTDIESEFHFRGNLKKMVEIALETRQEDFRREVKKEGTRDGDILSRRLKNI